MKKFLKSSFIFHHLGLLFRSLIWFFIGMSLGFFFLISFAFIIFQKYYGEKVYPGVMVENTNFGGKTEKYVEDYYTRKNAKIQNVHYSITYNDTIATISAQQLLLGYDAKLLARQTFSIGRSSYIFSNIILVFQAYLNGIHLSPAYTYSQDQLTAVLDPLIQKARIAPIDAQFTFENGKVAAFRLSSNGQEADIDILKNTISTKIPFLLTYGHVQTIPIPLPVKKMKPAISMDDINNYGIKELIGMGTSLYHYSIDSRKYNVALAASRVSNILVAPNQIFSFDQALGDVSYLTGYKQAYVIENHKTVLGDGGGVCQVSTTLFRAILNAGLPVVERHAHAYRVEYYEEDSDPGIDATVFYPSVDLKFKNDTGHYILIQSIVNPEVERLTYYLYGTSDGRQVTISKPVITSQTPAPAPLYQDDPALPKGVIKQTDFAAAGAHVYFTRQVVKDGKTLINETYASDYQPWQAVYLRGIQ